MREVMSRRGPQPARHGVSVPRGQSADPPAQAPGGRYAKMFPHRAPCAAGDDALRALFELMLPPSPDDPNQLRVANDPAGAPFGLVDNPTIPAGFTYLGQFVDHDLTFDPTPALERLLDPDALVDFRTPRFDLDCLYGTGPDDQPFLYDWDDYAVGGTKLLVDQVTQGPHAPFDDLPRNREQRALIGDARNDEHLIIAQLHLLFIKFHNAVVDHLHRHDGVPDADLFAGAREKVRWHYQWIVVHELLTHIVGTTIASEVLTPAVGDGPPTPHLKYYRWHRRPPIAFEFSTAAYRMGHSMVRPDYKLNDFYDVAVPILPDPPDRDPSLVGHRRLRYDLVIDWKHFFALPGGGGPQVNEPQLALRIDTTIAPPLFRLPDGNALPWLNLKRGQRVGLPSGQDVAAAMGEAKLDEEQLLLSGIASDEIRHTLATATPLWYWILCEALAGEGAGNHLGRAGGRIVAEVLVGLLLGDPESYLNATPEWKPDLGPTPGSFSIADLVQIAMGTISLE